MQQSRGCWVRPHSLCHAADLCAIVGRDQLTTTGLGLELGPGFLAGLGAAIDLRRCDVALLKLILLEHQRVQRGPDAHCCGRLRRLPLRIQEAGPVVERAFSDHIKAGLADRGMPVIVGVFHGVLRFACQR